MFDHHRLSVTLFVTAIALLSIAGAGCNGKPDTPPTKPSMTAGVAHYPPGMKLGPDGKPVPRGQ